MAKKVITQKARISVAKKRWYSLQAPKMFNDFVFGETLAEEPESLVGRTSKVNLSNIVKGAKKLNMEAKFRIVEVKGNICATELVSLEILPPNVKRIVKRAKKRVDDSFAVVTKDDIKVRLKPILLVKDNVQHGILTALRASCQTFFEKVAKENTFNELVNKIVFGEMYRDLKGELKKVYPVSGIEMRAVVRE
jgi:small subunit ribosomal protein S3Ae